MTSSPGRMAGKVALISGAARGMGESHARLLLAHGASVVIGDILDDEGQALAADLGPSARYVHLDVTVPGDWDAAVQTAVDAFGTVTTLVNNAGIVGGNLLPDYELSAWNEILAVNLTGTFLGMRAVSRTMIAAQSGSIINVSSVEGFRGSAGLHGYVASKFGVRGLAKSAALELAPHGIRVNSIHPGFIRTPMTAGIPEDFLTIPLGRGADPIEVSNFVLFLASDESAYATGTEFVIDGGLITGVPHKSM